jgi:hypothetical protein
MKFNVGTIVRIIRGLIGAIMVIISIINSSWIGLPGIILLFCALSGRCGFGSNSCEYETDTNSENNIKPTLKQGV